MTAKNMKNRGELIGNGIFGKIGKFDEFGEFGRILGEFGPIDRILTAQRTFLTRTPHVK